MKRVLLISLLLCSVGAFAQGDVIYRQSRIDLGEKMNLPMRGAPALLIKAYGEGAIKAYYPKKWDKPVNYPEFLDFFGLQQVDFSGKEGKDVIPCLEELFLQLDQNTLDCFSANMDIYEDAKFDQVKSHHRSSIKYVQIRFSKECTETQRTDYAGPVFKYSDIEKLPRRYKLLNAKNDGANYTLKQMFNLRFFKAVILKSPDKGNRTDENVWDN